MPWIVSRCKELYECPGTFIYDGTGSEDVIIDNDDEVYSIMYKLFNSQILIFLTIFERM
jgi:hypothetical protein